MIKRVAVIGVILLALVLSAMPGCSPPKPTATPAPTPKPAPTAAPAAKPTASAPAASKPAASAPTVTIKMALYAPPPGPAGGGRVKGLKWWMDEVEARSNGKVKIEAYWSESLFKNLEILDAVQKSSVDMGEVQVSSYASKLSLNNFTYAVPFHSTNPAKVGEIGLKLFDTVPALTQELQQYGQKPVFISLAGGTELLLTKKAVRHPENLKGMKIRTVGTDMPKVMAAVGAVPVTIAAGELFDALRLGTVEGGTGTLEAFLRNGWADVSKYVFIFGYGANIGFLGTINIASYQKLDPSVQKLLLEVGREANTVTSKWLSEENEQYVKTLKDKGLEVITLPATERKAWRDMPQVRAVVDDWVAAQEKKGLPGKQLMDAFFQLGGAD